MVGGASVSGETSPKRPLLRSPSSSIRSGCTRSLGFRFADPSQFAGSEQVRRTLTQREVVVFDGFGFRCEATQVDAGDQVLTVRTGVAEEFLSSSSAYRSESSTQRRSAYRQRRPGRGQTLIGGQPAETATGPHIATASDGCLLEVSVENR